LPKKKYIRDFGTVEPEEYWNEVKEKVETTRFQNTWIES
jgi:hypothetical protein